jgi:cytidylate kinase
MNSLIQIAIDGPVGAGKSTVAKQLADKFELLYVDTGAMYRALALAAVQNNISWKDEISLGKLAKTISIVLEKPVGSKKDGRTVTVYLDSKDVSWEIRTPEISEGASVVSQYLAVRQVLVKKQQALARKQAVIMEGRDIGTNVLPKANLKIYMDADVDERIRRKQIQTHSVQSQARQDLLKRDDREMGRKNNPLRPAKDAWILDTTELSIDEVIAIIAKKVIALRN